MYLLCGSVVTVYTCALCVCRCFHTQTCITLRDLLQMVNGFFEPTRTQLICSELKQISKINGTTGEMLDVDISMWKSVTQQQHIHTNRLFSWVKQKRVHRFHGRKEQLRSNYHLPHGDWTSVDMEIFYHKDSRMHPLLYKSRTKITQTWSIIRFFFIFVQPIIAFAHHFERQSRVYC